MKPKTTRKAPIDECDRSMHCHTCGRAIAGFERVYYDSIERGYRDLCNTCLNKEVAVPVRNPGSQRRDLIRLSG